MGNVSYGKKTISHDKKYYTEATVSRLTAY